MERLCDLAGDLPPADCYWFEVPENRSDPASRLIRLWVAVVHGTGETAGNLPTIGLAGGPGDPDSTAWVSGNLVFAGGSNPTIVVIDQRGTGRSDPRLACTELDPIASSTGGIELLVEERRSALGSCRDRLVDDGVDLDGYNTTQSAMDVVELRAALGIDRWIVHGWSYGGRLAQEVYRQDPAGVAGLLLDGTMTTRPWQLDEVAENAQSAIDDVSAACAAAPDCASMGDLGENLRRAEALLDAEPYTLLSGDL
ncbi:MAG: alpha/beta fold hydrolase, partial [Ilumatobacter sp.]|nr:alpha/beta fold hydrolase [Ilumatobacter sp.]